MAKDAPIVPRAFRALGNAHFDDIAPLQRMERDRRLDIEAVSRVLPFRVNEYVIDELIDWDRVPDDPMFQLTFPQEGMLAPRDLRRMRDLLHRGADRATIEEAARAIRSRMNPHPAGQLSLNVPRLQGEAVQGVQHKYRETTLFFPAAGQTCHAYCTYCFRWPQFVGDPDLRFASRDVEQLVQYLREHPEVTDVLFTGGDPMIMKTAVLRRYVEPLLGIGTVRSIRFGTKAPAYWPYRFVTDPDADDLMRLFEEVVASGRHLALMAHYSHPVELSTAVARKAVRRILDTGATVRCQAPLIRHVNDRSDVWARMWQLQVELGAVPYYMFVERDTGPKNYFEVPLARALEVFQRAYQRVSGLARTVRGPSMSATPGKVLVDGVATIGDEKVFVLKFLQGRDPRWVEKIFFAAHDDRATWLDDLEPAFGEQRFFFERRVHGLRAGAGGEQHVFTGGPRLDRAAGDDTEDGASL
jgi:KamA family protein